MHHTVNKAINDISTAFGHSDSTFGYGVLYELARLPVCEQEFCGDLLRALCDGKKAQAYGNIYLDCHWVFPWTIVHMPSLDDKAASLSAVEASQLFLKEDYERKIKAASRNALNLYIFSNEIDRFYTTDTLPCKLEELLICFYDSTNANKTKAEYAIAHSEPFLVFDETYYEQIVAAIDTVEEETLDELQKLLRIIEWHFTKETETKDKLASLVRNWSNTDIDEKKEKERAHEVMTVLAESGAVADFQTALAGVPLDDILV